jgi:hypothetical protein
MKGMNIMYGYQGKIFGMILAGVGLLTLVVQKLTGFTVMAKYDSAQHFNILLVITIMGMFTMMFSKEKMEDERVQAVRTKSLLYAFMLTAGVPIAYAMTLSLQPESMIDAQVTTTADVLEEARLLMFYPALGMVLYLIMFHVGLYFDSVWDYEDEAWSPKTIFQHRRNKLLVIVVSITVLLLMFLLIR